MLRAEGVSLDRFFYCTNDIVLSIKGQDSTIIVPSGKVQAINIVKHYDSKVMPFISIDLNIQRSDFRNVMDNIADMTVKFELYKYRYNTGGTKFKFKCFSGMYKAINQKQLDVTLAGQYKSYDNQEELSAQNTVLISLFLYDNSKYEQLRIMKSYNISGNMNDVIYHNFKDRKFKDVLMTSVSDTSTNTFNIPYSTLVGSLNYLNNVHGIYDAPYLFFMDFNTTYLIDEGHLGKAVRSLEAGVVHMYLEEYGSQALSDIGSYSDEKINILNISILPQVVDVDENIEYMLWSKLSGVISGENNIVELEGTNSNVEKSVVVNNSKVLSQEEFKVNESRRLISLLFNDVDIDIFTPNKLFKLIAHADYVQGFKIGGDYRIDNCVITLSKQGESDLMCGVKCSFRKQAE